MLDTTFLIDAERRRQDLDTLIADGDDIAIAAVTVAELLVGAQLGNGRRRKARQSCVEGVIRNLPTLPYDLRVARAHADLLVAVRHAGRPRGAHDLLIAATAAAYHRVVVTVDASGFEGLPDIQVMQ